jgi:hypothetical protein
MGIGVRLRFNVKRGHGIPCGVAMPDRYISRIASVDLQGLAIRQGNG